MESSIQLKGRENTVIFIIPERLDTHLIQNYAFAGEKTPFWG